jgi:hypothetical protein
VPADFSIVRNGQLVMATDVGGSEFADPAK